MNIDPNLPVNKIAAIVVDSGVKLNSEYARTTFISSMVPLPTILFRGHKRFDLEGLVFGRLKVIGVSARIPKKKSGSNAGSRWVVRCSCGRYEILSGRSLRKGTSIMCHDCERNQRRRKLQPE